MDKYTELEKQAQKFLDETDTMQFSTVELLTMFYNHQEQLRIGGVSGMFSAKQMEQAFNDGVKAEQQRCGEFDIENYC
jgi:hypothetical protein